MVGTGSVILVFLFSKYVLIWGASDGAQTGKQLCPEKGIFILSFQARRKALSPSHGTRAFTAWPLAHCLCPVADIGLTILYSLPHVGIRDKVSDWAEFLRQTLTDACSPPVPLLEGVSISSPRKPCCSSKAI